MELSQDILNKLATRTISYIKNDLGMDGVEDDFEVKDVDQLDLLDITAMVALSGCAKGTVGLSVSNEMAFEMVKNFIFGDMPESELKELANENVAETLNIVLGNILTELEAVKNGATVDISSPYTIHNRVSITKKKDGKMYCCLLKYKNENILLSYFI